jgi:hypothetical protein
MVESSSDEILEGARDSAVAFLVVGDPFGYIIISIISVVIKLTQFQ